MMCGVACEVPRMAYVAVVEARSADVTVVEEFPPGARKIGPVKFAGSPMLANPARVVPAESFATELTLIVFGTQAGQEMAALLAPFPVATTTGTPREFRFEIALVTPVSTVGQSDE